MRLNGIIVVDPTVCIRYGAGRDSAQICREIRFLDRLASTSGAAMQLDPGPQCLTAFSSPSPQWARAQEQGRVLRHYCSAPTIRQPGRSPEDGSARRRQRRLDDLSHPSSVETAQAGTWFDGIEGEHGVIYTESERAAAVVRQSRSLANPSHKFSRRSRRRRLK
jgi:hypothetical protein